MNATQAAQAGASNPYADNYSDGSFSSYSSYSSRSSSAERDPHYLGSHAGAGTGAAVLASGSNYNYGTGTNTNTGVQIVNTHKQPLIGTTTTAGLTGTPAVEVIGSHNLGNAYNATTTTTTTSSYVEPAQTIYFESSGVQPSTYIQPTTTTTTYAQPLATNFTTTTNPNVVDPLVQGTNTIASNNLVGTGFNSNNNHNLVGTGLAGAGLVGTGLHNNNNNLTTVQPTNLVTNNVADIDHAPDEPLKGRGGKLRNKFLRRRYHRHHRGEALNVDQGIVDRSKFTGAGPIDKLDQKLAGRNYIDNAIAQKKGDLYHVGGFPAMESYRQEPDNIMRHKFTGQTHFDSELPTTGPGFTNGDLYDKPAFAGTKAGQPHHSGPITALAHKIVGQKYTTHEPMLDKAFVEPNHRGPIDRVAHMLVGGSHDHKLAGSVGNEQVVLNQPQAVYTTVDADGDTKVVDGGRFRRLKNRLHHHHKRGGAVVVNNAPYSGVETTGQTIVKDILPVSTGVMRTAVVTNPVVTETTVTTTTTEVEEVGTMKKLAGKILHHHQH